MAWNAHIPLRQSKWLDFSTERSAIIQRLIDPANFPGLNVRLTLVKGR